ncbi:hypothetical protein ACCAA_180044 [Candidatus Accumulibacter aalborgensis]|uniref:Uncharacterized protein n=1 Tax=Candidatus Accumulibacter aalborgensis TaxID=1860102 RepID=A0A1A8XLD9_9PROT|nr:hypothetical protein ACCAA_180044 [Candidatus Accumulibacter aalborgensis]
MISGLVTDTRTKTPRVVSKVSIPLISGLVTDLAAYIAAEKAEVSIPLISGLVTDALDGFTRPILRSQSL